MRKREVSGLQCLADATGGRYLAANDAKELTRALEQTVALKEPRGGPATLSGPASVEEGQWFEVGFTGPTHESDRIAVADPAAQASTWLVANSPKQAREGKVRLLARLAPGRYELRYVLASGKIAARAPLEVTPGAATLHAPSSVNAGQRFEVRWTGPDGEYDLVQLSRPEQRANDWVRQTTTFRKNGVETLTAPSQPGRYEVRYRWESDSSHVQRSRSAT